MMFCQNLREDGHQMAGVFWVNMVEEIKIESLVFAHLAVSLIHNGRIIKDISPKAAKIPRRKKDDDSESGQEKSLR
jgi:hypothetical protein